MASSLKILATPIGNIRDISLRALDSLKAADVILAEDTRHTKALLNALSIELKAGARLISCHSQLEKHRATLVLSMLEQNLNIILVSDAGSPAISDPGSLLVQAIVEAGMTVEVLPGPSALTAALMGAGIDTTRFAFLGFLPKKTRARETIIMGAAKAELALVVYESPLRVAALIDELFTLLGPRRVVVARELTKIFETFHRGVLGASLQPPLVEKGECVVIVEGASVPALDGSEQEISDFIHSAQVSTNKDLVNALMTKFKLKKSIAYDLVLKRPSQE